MVPQPPNRQSCRNWNHSIDVFVRLFSWLKQLAWGSPKSLDPFGQVLKLLRNGILHIFFKAKHAYSYILYHIPNCGYFLKSCCELRHIYIYTNINTVHIYTEISCCWPAENATQILAGAKRRQSGMGQSDDCENG